MSDINALLSFVEGRIERLEGDNAARFTTEIDAHLAAWLSVQGVFLFAHEMNRIADLLEKITWTPDDNREADDDQQRALIVIQPSAQG